MQDMHAGFVAVFPPLSLKTQDRKKELQRESQDPALWQYYAQETGKGQKYGMNILRLNLKKNP